MPSHSHSDATVKALATAIQGYKLEDVYQFPLDEKSLERLKTILPPETALPISAAGTVFDRTLALRKVLANSRLWSNTRCRVSLAGWVIKDWGGIKSKNKPDEEDAAAPKNGKLLATLLDKADEYHRKCEFAVTDVASWSKYLAFRFPATRAIFDARTAYALNWLLWQSTKSSRKEYFPSPPGRNTLLNALDYRLWLAAKVLGRQKVAKVIEEDIASREREGGKSSAVSDCMSAFALSGKSFYEEYCSLLSAVAREVYPQDPTWGLTKIEMTLFGIATTDIARKVFNTIVPPSASSEVSSALAVEDGAAL